MVGAGGGLDLNNIAIFRLGASTPPEAPEGTAKRIARGAIDPDWGPR